MRRLTPPSLHALVTLPILVLYLSVAPQWQLSEDLTEADRHHSGLQHQGNSRLETQDDPAHKCHNCLASHPPVFSSSPVRSGLAVALSLDQNASSGRAHRFFARRPGNLHLRSPPA